MCLKMGILFHVIYIAWCAEIHYDLSNLIADSMYN